MLPASSKTSPGTVWINEYLFHEMIVSDGSQRGRGACCVSSDQSVIFSEIQFLNSMEPKVTPHFSGTFEDEAYAIKYAPSSPGRKFSIFYDFQSVLMAISSSSKTIPIIRKIQKRACSLLRQSVNVQFHWVPGHN